MSGHSHWATTKRDKGVKDAARGKLFSKLGRTISLAAKSGDNPDTNSKLRFAIEAARAVNMPKDNIERAIAKGSKQDTQLEEVMYEGFGPGGIGVIVEAATDNRNRTAQEIKNIFDKGGGNLGGPGSVSFNFDPKGLIVVNKSKNPEEDMLNLIDLGVEDIEDIDDVIEIYTTPSELGDIKRKIEDKGYKIDTVELVRKPKNYLYIDDREVAKKAMALLDELEDYDDVQKVYTNVGIPADLNH